MEKNDYVYIVQIEGCLSTESFYDIIAPFAKEEDAKKCIEEESAELLSSIHQYVDFEKGYDTDESAIHWEVRSKKWSDLYIRYFYEKVLVQ